ncbi:MAG: hypothetical protein ACTSO5_12255 [Candidatus Heimdallarchaeaceae archaeon]
MTLLIILLNKSPYILSFHNHQPPLTSFLASSFISIDSDDDFITYTFPGNGTEIDQQDF